MNTEDMNKDELIEKIEQLEQAIDEITELKEENKSLRLEADEFSDYKHDTKKKFETIFYMGARSGLNHENTFKAWLNYKIEARL